jgi:hypothetical protein
VTCGSGPAAWHRNDKRILPTGRPDASICFIGGPAPVHAAIERRFPAATPCCRINAVSDGDRAPCTRLRESDSAALAVLLYSPVPHRPGTKRMRKRWSGKLVNHVVREGSTRSPHKHFAWRAGVLSGSLARQCDRTGSSGSQIAEGNGMKNSVFAVVGGFIAAGVLTVQTGLAHAQAAIKGKTQGHSTASWPTSIMGASSIMAPASSRKRSADRRPSSKSGWVPPSRSSSPRQMAARHGCMDRNKCVSAIGDTRRSFAGARSGSRLRRSSVVRVVA